MKTEEEIRKKLKFLEDLLNDIYDEEVVLGTATKQKIRGKINIIKWILEDNDKEKKK